jgi:hypothetical protein
VRRDSRPSVTRERELDREIERYRADATPALEQLELIVAYLYKIRKPELVRAVDRNRKRILERIS